MSDPTYIKEEIEANKTWHLAWVLSELDNDDAPIGWGEYISVAAAIISCKPKAVPFLLDVVTPVEEYIEAVCSLVVCDGENIKGQAELMHSCGFPVNRAVKELKKYYTPRCSS